MAQQEALTVQNSGLSSWIKQTPNLGAWIFVTVFLWKPVAHALTVSFHLITSGMTRHVLAFLIGLGGFALVWCGFKKDETEATILGFFGGSLIFIGWFEESFHIFDELLMIPPLKWQGFTLFTGNLLLIQASVVIYLAMLIFMGSNKDTRCRMFMWFHRHLKIRPGDPTKGYKRQFSRITAVESVFISWFFYITTIMLFDPRIFGPDHIGAYMGCGLSFAWALYLLPKLLKHRAPGSAIRYSLPVVAAFWMPVEMGSLWQWFPEIWVKPFEYPVSNIALTCLFAFAMGTLVKTFVSAEKQPSAA